MIPNTQEGRAKPAPPARFRGSVGSRYLLLMVATMIVATSCSLFRGYGQESSPSGSASQSAASSESGAPSLGSGSSEGTAPSLGPCQPAPEWLVAVLQDGLAMPGATLSEAYVGEAWSFTSGPAAVMSAEFASAWWTVAKVNGAGVRPEVVVWVTNRTGKSQSGTIFGANPSAVRYSHFGQGGSNAIRGDGLEALLACLTPIPES